jgi:hypothetical protein
LLEEKTSIYVIVSEECHDYYIDRLCIC